MDDLTIYIAPNRSNVLYKKNVILKDIASVYCDDPGTQKTVEDITLFTFHEQMDGRQVITMLYVIEEIHKQIKDATVITLGDPEFIVFHKKESENPKKKQKQKKTLQIIKIVFVCMVSFFGTAFSIMTYNNDVGVNDLFTYLYTLFMGTKPEGNTALDLGYALGLPVGLLVFFNHVSRHRLTDEPTPLEVQMRLYERDVNDAVAISSGRNEKTLDV